MEVCLNTPKAPKASTETVTRHEFSATEAATHKEIDLFLLNPLIFDLFIPLDCKISAGKKP